MDDHIEVPVSTGFTAQVSPDKKYILLSFRTSKEPVNIAIPSQNADTAISGIIGAAQELAATEPSNVPNEETITTRPIDIVALGVAPGRTETEAFLSAKLGPLNLTFAIQVSTLLQTLENLQSMTIRTGVKSKPN